MHMVNSNAQMAHFISCSQIQFVFVTVFADQLYNGHELCDRTGNVAGHHQRYDKEKSHCNAQSHHKKINGRTENLIERFFGYTFQKDKA